MLKLGTQFCLKTLLPNIVKLPIVNLTKSENSVLVNSLFVRNASFFNRLTQQQLWKGVTSVSNAGRRKGRARKGSLKGKRNLNEGKILGEGKEGMSWPGLNVPIFKEQTVAKIEKSTAESKPKVSVTAVTKRYSQLNPLERGWSGRKTKGRKIGPPPSLSDQNFQSIVLEQKSRLVITSHLGRKRRVHTIVATGNGNGIVGVGSIFRSDFNSSLTLAHKQAGKRLLAIDLIENHTVNHDFFIHYGNTKIFVYRKSRGFGLKCHRVIKALCELIGITDLAAKIEGPCNVTKIIRAFITGLRRQKTYQQIADETSLHLVEFREDTLNFPRVLASPQKCLTLREKMKNHILFEEYIMGGRLVYHPPPKVPFYVKQPSWITHLKRTLYQRNHKKVRLELIAKYDTCKSHLSDIYPECVDSAALSRKRLE